MFRRSISAPLVSDKFSEPMIRRFGCALERIEIDVHHAETAVIAFCPLEVIEQRPNEIAAQICTSGERATGSSEVGAQIGDAVVIAYEAVRCAPIIVASAVLGYIEVEIAILVAWSASALR